MIALLLYPLLLAVYGTLGLLVAGALIAAGSGFLRGVEICAHRIGGHR